MMQTATEVVAALIWDQDKFNDLPAPAPQGQGAAVGVCGR